MKTGMILTLFLSFSVHAQTAPTSDELAQAKSISEKLYLQMAKAIPSQLSEKDILRSECGARDLYITCYITDDAGDVGYTHGISVQFDHYGREIAVNSIHYIEH